MTSAFLLTFGASLVTLGNADARRGGGAWNIWHDGGYWPGYAAGVAIGATIGAIGSSVYTLPGNCIVVEYGKIADQQCDEYWMRNHATRARGPHMCE